MNKLLILGTIAGIGLGIAVKLMMKSNNDESSELSSNSNAEPA